MTRFARSEGSKGSNKREPEEATPWSVMVKQIQAKQPAGVEDEVEYREGDVEEKMEVVDKLLDDVEEDENDEVLDSTILDDIDFEGEIDEDASENNKRKDVIELVSAEEPKKKKRKKSEKCKVCGEKGHRKMDCGRLPEDRRKELQELFTMKVERKGKGTGRKKNKNKNDGTLPYENTEGTEGILVDNNKTTATPPPRFANTQDKTSNKQKKDKSGAVVESGEGMFQGFRVKMEDQERLQKLQKKLKATGLPKQELEATMKKERRTAEKCLARSKKLVCFNCREPGHMLADCPNAKAEENDVVHAASGHCFKCGSLEHTSKDCKSKLKRENAYRFAVCFICKQEGHLAKTCPDNPKGLYPKGGGCIFCGSVEHLKRDCPRKVEKDMKQGVRVGVIGDANLEEEQVFDTAKMIKKKKKMMKEKKVVVF
eukprot:GFUD01015810.1.p1 GENE.GFUD01015810.1~~GFUD01015810.1.p1  ORF type:complete len:427 (+),score=170.41 GFUD01015810.1:77-1357(+)